MAARVLLAQKLAGLGGAQVSLVQHLEHLDRARYDPHVVVGAEGWLTQKLDAMKIAWTRVSFPQWNLGRAVANLRLIRALDALIREKGVSLVHANEHWVGPPALLAARRAGVPAICHFRTGLEDLTPWRVRKYLYGRYDRVLAVAGVLQRALAARVAEPARIVLVRDGVESPAARPARHGRGRCIAITVGALRTFKGQRKVLERALPWLEKDRRRYLVFVGGDTEPQYAASIRDRVREKGLGRQVRMVGNREDVARLLGFADVLVAYSSLEGVPRTVMEAMLAGLPVIVSDTPGMEEVVTPDVGRRVVFETEPNPVAAALEAVCAEPERWRAMGERARQIAAEHYSTRATTRAIEQVYEALLR